MTDTKYREFLLNEPSDSDINEGNYEMIAYEKYRFFDGIWEKRIEQSKDPEAGLIHTIEYQALEAERAKVKSLAIALRGIYLYALDLSWIEETNLANLIEQSYLDNEDTIEKYGGQE